MRKKLCFLLAVFITSFFYAQTHKGDVVLSSQKEVDNFKGTKIIGNLIIREYIENPDVISTSQSIITNIKSLSQLTFLDGDLKIIRNSKLSNLDGLEGIKEITGSIEIKGNNSLKNINGLRLIKKIGKNITIINNRALSNSNGLSSIPIVHGDLNIQNSGFRKLEGLSSLEVIEGNLIIKNNEALVSINSLLNLKKIKGNFILTANKKLISACSIVELFQTEAAIGSISVANNSEITSNVIDIINNCQSLACTHPKNDVWLKTQEEVDAFDYCYIKGSLIISDEMTGKIKNIEKLRNLKGVGENLIIKNNTELKDVYVLGRLKNKGSIGGDLELDNNSALPEGVFKEARSYFLCDNIALRLKVRKKSTQDFVLYLFPESEESCDKDSTPGNPFANEDGEDGSKVNPSELLSQKINKNVYPTISNGREIHITGLENDFNYKIYTISGRLIEEKTMLKGSKNVTIHFKKQLTSGIYIIKILEESENSNFRFIIR
ncbi:T9SS type A sorting domain-containing protein [Aquimarina algiphila]|uniref:T9SS type A sorting domain-containing protein n=1 Tax=Aquimarina algiphila TaxID=2047982 RepID=UPI002490A638|nr:T9SS type A sorting domain-containing protein [Aquimarina algiphila]